MSFVVPASLILYRLSSGDFYNPGLSSCFFLIVIVRGYLHIVFTNSKPAFVATGLHL